jgi:RNA polymerase sigma-70 factor (ECF subfamily)
MRQAQQAPSITEPLSDELLVRRVLAGEPQLFELLMRRHNQKIYRAVRSLLRDEAEVEDVMQQAYLSAFLHLDQFHGGSQLSTWLVRIAINEALHCLRRQRRFVIVQDVQSDQEEPIMKQPSQSSNPEEATSGRELAGLLEQAVDRLPTLYRTVLMLREVEGMSTAEVASALGVSEEVVKTRLKRSRALLEEHLCTTAGEKLSELFHFHAPRCDRLVQKVLAAITHSSENPDK